MSVNLPTEIHQHILSHLMSYAYVEYQLVCKQWSQPAKEAFYRRVYFHNSKQFCRFVDFIKAQPSFGLMVKEVELHFSGWDRAPKMEEFSAKYLELAQYTPNMEIVVGMRSLTSTINDIVKRGLWSRLHNVQMSDKNSSVYYELLLRLSERLSTVAIDLQYLLNCAIQDHATYNSFLATKSTQFKRAKKLICSGPVGMPIQTLDHMFNMFPSINKLKLDTGLLEGDMRQLKGLQTNRCVKKINASFESLEPNYIQYIFQKFPRTDHIFFTFKHMNDPFGFFNLIRLVEGMDRIDLMIWNGFFYMENIRGFNRMPFRTRKTIRFEDKLAIESTKLVSGGVHTSLQLFTSYNEDIDFTASEDLLFLATVNELILYDWVLNDPSLLGHYIEYCSRLTKLRIEGGEIEELDEPFFWPHITDIEFRGGISSTEMLKHVVDSFPDLRNITVFGQTIYPEHGDVDTNLLVIDMSLTSIHSLVIINSFQDPYGCVYVKVKTEDKIECFKVKDCKFNKITTKEYVGLSRETGRIDLACKSIKELCLDMSGTYVHHTF